MKQIYFLLLISFLIIHNQLNSQSQFATKEELAEYLEGEWNVDKTYWMGNVNIQVGKSIEFYTNDSSELICKYFDSDTLVEQSKLKIEFEDADGFPGPWRLNGLPGPLPSYVAIFEDENILHPLSMDTMTLIQISFDGIEMVLSRLSTNTNDFELGTDIIVFPNPTKNILSIKGKGSETSYLIYDLSGKLLKKGNLNDNSIELNNLFGTLILKLNIGDRWIAKKIFKIE